MNPHQKAPTLETTSAHCPLRGMFAGSDLLGRSSKQYSTDGSPSRAAPAKAKSTSDTGEHFLLPLTRRQNKKIPGRTSHSLANTNPE